MRKAIAIGVSLLALLWIIGKLGGSSSQGASNLAGPASDQANTQEGKLPAWFEQAVSATHSESIEEDENE